MPTSDNPVIYTPLDFAVFEGTEGSNLIITVIQKRRKTEPTHWWKAVEDGNCVKRCLALYREKIPCTEVLALLQSLSPRITWELLPPAGEPLNPYRFEGFFNGRSQTVELQPGLVDEGDLTTQLLGLIASVSETLCQE